MKRALRELRIEGIKTTIPLHEKILNHSAFIETPRRYHVHRADVADVTTWIANSKLSRSEFEPF